MCRFVTSELSGSIQGWLLILDSDMKISSFRNWFCHILEQTETRWLIVESILDSIKDSFFHKQGNQSVPPAFCFNGPVFTMPLFFSDTLFLNSNKPFVDRFSALSLWQLASRCVYQQLVPMVTLNVSLMSGNDSVSSRVLQTEPSTLLHIISTLEAALETSKTSHARRMLRSI